MASADAVGGILLAGVTLYAVLGGADFGGGLWDLLAGGAARGRSPRALIDESITPVWEANHVWLVFDLVIFWTAFPVAFTAVMNALWVPLWLAVAGIVLRGAGFAFRKEVTLLSMQRVLGAAFALSSLVTPFFMGTVVGAIATGSVPAGTRVIMAAWTSPTALLAGFLFVAACGYLAAVYLAGEAASRGDPVMGAYFTRRAQAAAVVAGGLSLGLLWALHGSDRELYDRLTGRALPLVVLAAVCGVVVLLFSGRRAWVRFVAALGVAAVVWGWGVAQYPVLLPGTGVTLTSAGAPPDTYTALVVLFIVAVVLLVPSFGLLFTLQGRRLLGEGPSSGGAPSAAHRAAAAEERPGPATRAAVLGVIAIAVVIRRQRGRFP
jgi:cytochrome d ubiquinol oxidase subunit II